MPRQYSPQFRERAVALVEHGHDFRDLAIELDIAAATIYYWRRQARIDAGEIAGVNTAMASELTDAKRRLRMDNRWRHCYRGRTFLGHN